MDSKVDLKVIDGQRDNLENQIALALFTEFDQKKLETTVNEINQKLKPRGQLKAVSDMSQIPQDEH